MKNFTISERYNQEELKKTYKKFTSLKECLFKDMLDVFKFMNDNCEAGEVIKITYNLCFLEAIHNKINQKPYESFYESAYNKGANFYYDCLIQPSGVWLNEKEVLSMDRDWNNGPISYHKMDYKLDEDRELHMLPVLEHFLFSLEDIYCEILGCSGIYNGESNNTKKFSIIIKLPNKEKGKKRLLNNLKGRVEFDTTYTVEKLEEKILQEIYSNDKEFGKEGIKVGILALDRNDYIKGAEIRLILLILHIKGFIFIRNNNLETKQNSKFIFVDIIRKDDKRSVVFNKYNGTVLLDNTKIGTIKANTQEYTFFEHLYDKKGKFITHYEMRLNIIGTQVINNTDGNFLSVIKQRLDKPIRDLIKAQKGGYILQDI